MKTCAQCGLPLKHQGASALCSYCRISDRRYNWRDLALLLIVAPVYFVALPFIGETK